MSTPADGSNSALHALLNSDAFHLRKVREAGHYLAWHGRFLDNKPLSRMIWQGATVNDIFEAASTRDEDAPR